MIRNTQACALLALATGAGASAQLLNNVVLTSNADAEAEALYTPVGGPDEFDADTDSDTAIDFAQFPLGVSASASNSVGSGFGEADLDATMSLNTFSATGSAYGEANGGSTDSTAMGFATAVFTVTFELTQTVDYTLDWTVFADGSGNIGNADISLRDGMTTYFSVLVEDVGFDDSGTAVGSLGPGVYTLTAGAGGAGFASDIDFNTSASGLFDLTFTVVPAPGGAALLAAGLAAAARRRR